MKSMLVTLMFFAAVHGTGCAPLDTAAGGPDDGGGTGGSSSIATSTLTVSQMTTTMPAQEPHEALCQATGGSTVALQCCINPGAWQDTCTPPSCGGVLTCDTTGAAVVEMCECPAGTCFDRTAGCVQLP